MKIAFIGGGNMASALIGGLLARGAKRSAICVIEPVPAARRRLAAKFKVHASAFLDARALAADTVVLAVKPQDMRAAAAPLMGRLGARLVISVAAGIRLKDLARWLGGHDRIVRVMPNTPCLIGSGAAGYALGPGASVADGELVGRLMRAVGIAFAVPESQLDAVTGLSGSGPAYVYTMIEALSDGGVRAGLPRATATALAAQTVFGAAQMVMSTGEHPGVLKDRVTSPGGTTIAGLQVLEQHGLRAALIDAVEAATNRSRELGQS